jgi:hypothetical protein
VDLLAMFFPVVVLQGFEQMEKIGKHGDPTGGSLAASPYVRYYQ